MIISGKTKVTGLFGWPVEHSLSPYMHNAAFQALGLDYCYITFSVRPDRLKDAVRAIRALSIKGVNVTVPHKEKVGEFLDEIDNEARFIGAVNTIVNKDDTLIGYNTDGRGFMKSLSEAGIETKGKNILIIGTGGACRAIAYYLNKEAGSLYLFDIDLPKADALAEDLGGVSSPVKDLKIAPDVDIIINATPLGLKDKDPLPIDSGLLRPHQSAIDLIYKDTPFLKEAKTQGLKTLDGLGMLLWQGVIAFELWTGLKPNVDIMRDALLKGRGYYPP